MITGQGRAVRGLQEGDLLYYRGEDSIGVLIRVTVRLVYTGASQDRTVVTQSEKGPKREWVAWEIQQAGSFVRLGFAPGPTRLEELIMMHMNRNSGNGQDAWSRFDLERPGQSDIRLDRWRERWAKGQQLCP